MGIFGLFGGNQVPTDHVDEIVGLAQLGQRPGVGEAGLLHDDGRLDIPVRAAQKLASRLVVEAGDDRDNPPRPVAQLL